MHDLECRRDVRVDKCDGHERVRACCYGTLVGYGNGKHADSDGRNSSTGCQTKPSCSQSKGKFVTFKTFKKRGKPMCP